MGVEKFDKNFVVKTNIQKEGLKFYNIEEKPFKIYGLKKENGMYVRIPKETAKDISEGVFNFHAHAAGGRVRFVTDSPYIAISVKYGFIGKMCHFALTGSAGFDMYVEENSKQIYKAVFVPPYEVSNGYESVIDFSDRKKRLITINFPLYTEVKDLFIGIKNGSILEEAREYKYTTPIVYYGSSITQGGCASRPGNSYQAIISRILDCDYINLGFSGSARGEDKMADYIANLNMSIFVYDYDNNAPTVEHLEKTHKRMFDRIRLKNPELPIIMMSRPRPHLTEGEQKRQEIIRATYQSAIDSGDKNVYFLSGSQLICGDFEETALIDSAHPNDSGFLCMSKVLVEIIKDILKD